MRWLWMLPVLLVGACAPPLPPDAYYTRTTRYSRAGHHPSPWGYAAKTPDSDNCGTPDTFKECAPAIWAPPPRIPVYAQQLEDIPGNISISDMHAKDATDQ